MKELLENLYLFEDTCNVYVVRNGHRAILIDFGAGEILDHLQEIGVEEVCAVLMTHHHRDQGQGLPRAASAGIGIWVPDAERDLFASLEEHWQAREIFNNYNVRQDRFSLLKSIPIEGILKDYSTYRFAGLDVKVLPTPGHTVGSISLRLDLNGTLLVFSGDLIAGPGKVWSLAATQWTYNGAEGIAASILSLLELQEQAPDLLLPSHGQPMRQPEMAMELLLERFWKLLDLRRDYVPMRDFIQQPYQNITRHLLRSRVSMANTYVLLSESKKALIIDFGYDFDTKMPAGNDRAARRPWLYTIPTLKRQYGVEKIDVVIPTHYHEDHVAGINLLREVEGTRVWASESFASILEDPASFDLPCLFFDPIPVDRRIPLETPFHWEEYEFTLYPLPGHTEYAVAIAFQVDGVQALATGDQYQDGDGLRLNYVYQNHYHEIDYARSAEVYRRVSPQLILSGHWLPLWVQPGYFDQIDEQAKALERLHRELLLESPNPGADGILARLSPYQASVPAGEPLTYQVEVRNPYPHLACASLKVVIPPEWEQAGGYPAPRDLDLELQPLAAGLASFTVHTPAGLNDRRARIAVDISFDEHRFGIQAEALLTIRTDLPIRKAEKTA